MSKVWFIYFHFLFLFSVIGRLRSRIVPKPVVEMMTNVSCFVDVYPFASSHQLDSVETEIEIRFFYTNINLPLGQVQTF